jgi:hypothetical protein
MHRLSLNSQFFGPLFPRRLKNRQFDKKSRYFLVVLRVFNG